MYNFFEEINYMNGLYPGDGGGDFSELAVLYVVIQKATF
jgi:hypothetical protein